MHSDIQPAGTLADCDACRDYAVEPSWYAVLSQARTGRDALLIEHQGHTVVHVPDEVPPPPTSVPPSPQSFTG